MNPQSYSSAVSTRKWTRWSWLAAVPLMAACGSDPAPQKVAPPPAPTSPSLAAPASVELVESGWRDLSTPMEGGTRTREAACTVKITNTSGGTLPVVWADIQFDSEDGKEKLGSQPAGANQLAAGQSETVVVSDWQIAPEERPFKCRVTNIH